MRRAATFRSAEASTIAGLLPPSSSTTGVRFFAAAAITIFPIGVPPVKKMWSHRLSRSAVVSGTPPVTTDTASGSRYCGTSSASAWAQCGDTSDGFSTAQLPPAIAAINGESTSRIG